MLKTICIATLTTVIALTPAYSAAPKECTDAHMKQMDAMIAKMTDAAKKKEAMTALDMSKAEMKKGNMEGCMKHMKEAHTAMGSTRQTNFSPGRSQGGGCRGLEHCSRHS